MSALGYGGYGSNGSDVIETRSGGADQHADFKQHDAVHRGYPGFV